MDGYKPPFAVSLLLRYSANPRSHHLKAAIRSLHCVVQNKHIRLNHTNEPRFPSWKIDEGRLETDNYPETTAYMLASILDSRNLKGPYFQSGYVTYPNNSMINWASKKHKTVANFTSEAEYMGLCDTAKSIFSLN